MDETDPYFYLDPDNNPLLIGTRVSSFGGRADYESGQDNGEFAGGGKSYDPASGWENPEPYAAVPPEWVKQGIVNYGDTIDVFNPQNPDNRMQVVVRDSGPGRKTGRGLDVAPNVLHQLGLETDQTIGMDLSKNFQGKHDNFGPGPNGEDELREEFRNRIADQPASSMVAGGPTLDSIHQAIQKAGDPVARNNDGSLDFGNGISVFPTGVVQAEAGNVLYQWFPGSTKPHIVNVNPKSKLLHDPNTGYWDVSDLKNPKPITLAGSGDPSSVDLSKIKPGDWNSVPEDIRDVAKNIAQFKYPKVSGFALRSPYFQNMFKVISKVDPTFNYQQYDVRQKALVDYSGQGKNGQNIIAYNTALRHMKSAKDASDELAKSYDASDQLSNYFVHHSKSLSGDPAYGNYLTNVNTLINEMGRAVSGGVPHEAELKRQLSTLAGGIGYVPNSKQRSEVMKQMAKLLGGRLASVEDNYVRAFGKKPDVSFLDPEAEQTLRDVGAKEIADQYGSHGGKRPYLDPENVDTTIQPFPGVAGSPQSTKVPSRHNNITNKTEVQINGQWVDLDTIRGGK